MDTERNTSTAGLSDRSLPYTTWQSILIVLSCFFIVTGTILGNLLVCMAVAIVRKLRTPSNLLIVSLAVSDLLVAALVMSLATVYEVMGEWVLGQVVCTTWTSLDVLLCTASILSLCAISVDRYLVITRPFQYAVKRTPLNMAGMVAFVWVLSALISLPPLFVHGPESTAGHCSVSQELGYQIYATIGAFYLPLGVMIVIYTRIYMVSARIQHAETRYSQQSSGSGESRLSPSIVVRSYHDHGVMGNGERDEGGGGGEGKDGGGGGGTTAVAEENHNHTESSSSDHSISCRDSATVQQVNRLMIPPNGGLTTSFSSGGSFAANRIKKMRKFKLFQKSKLNSIASSHDRKATKTLGVIMGAFTACWLPFFILALIKPFCDNPSTCIPHWLNSLFLWLGYANSFLNPIIYARFNRDFRTPFKEILLCRCRHINLRMRTESYVEQYGNPGGMLATGRSLSRPSVDTVVRYNCTQGYTYVKVGCRDEPVNADPVNE